MRGRRDPGLSLVRVWPRHTRKMLLFVGVGFCLSTIIAQMLGLLVSYNMKSSRHVLFDSPKPDREMLDSGISVRSNGYVGFGVLRRGWFTVRSGIGMEAPGAPFDVFSVSEPPWWSFPKSIGPFFAWTPGGHRWWGRLYQEELVSLDDWETFHGIEDARGFPALCYWHEIRSDGDRFETPGGVPVSDTDQKFVGNLKVRAIAWRPIWAGLAFNTVFYALLVYGGIALARMFRNDRRMRRGLCIECRYDLRRNYSRGCPECGWGRE